VLLLFDIDGTLVLGAAQAHRDALHEALLAVHGVDAGGIAHAMSPAGRTDGEIARALLLASGVSARRIDERADDVRERCCEAYARLCPPDLSHTVLPGISGLLSWLSGREDARLGLLTGNYEPIARLKLARAGLAKHFVTAPGAFGSDSEDRAALPAIARRRAGTRGHPYAREHTIVIGDTPRDIACARADGVRCVAVSTGAFSIAQLAGADQVVDDPRGLQEALSAELARPA
jgi:phosphoglycolate phosphatase-like HAD superfamily hydrolase